MPFDSNVFINCPFDKEYNSLLRSLVFIVIYLGLEPHLSTSRSGSHIRINEIKKLIRNCKYSIHDLSRSKAMKAGELPRFNMPYELGLDIGSIEYGGVKFKRKRVLILETEKYHYQKVISDIAGQDIQNHNDDPEVLIQKVRDWMVLSADLSIEEGSTAIWISYIDFNTMLSERLAGKYTNGEIEELQIVEYIRFVKEYINQYE